MNKRTSESMDAAGHPQDEGSEVAHSIVVNDLVKVFKRIGGEQVNAVDGVSLTVNAGEMVVLLGPSGCGKTTLLRCIAGLEHPASGEIHTPAGEVFSSERRLNMPPERRQVSMMFQSYALWPHMTVFENVAYPLAGRGAVRATGRSRSRREISEKVTATLGAVGLSGLESQYPGQLSGGQQQRVALARSLVVDPQVILFDEPLSNVDAKVRIELRLELATKQQEIGFAGIYVTHDQHEALQMADHILVLDRGQVVQHGTPTDIYRNPRNRYVAKFVGQINEIPGTVVAKHSSGELEVETSIGRFVGGVGSTVEVGAEAIVAIRPECLVPATTSSSTVNNIDLTVRAVMFAGSHTEYAAKAGDIEMQFWCVDRDMQERLAPGADVRVVARPNDVLVIEP